LSRHPSRSPGPALALSLAGLLLAGAAAAQPAAPAGSTPPVDPARDDSDQAAPMSRDRTRASFWAQGPTRAFFSTAIDVGYLYLRPRVSLGYGHPFWTWIGVDANPQISNNFLGAYAGLRAALPFVDVRGGWRYVFPYNRSYLAPQDHYSRLAIEDRTLARSTYTALEAEVSGGVPVGPGSILFVGTVNRMSGVPAGTYAYDENLRVIVGPPNLWRGRLGYAVRLGAEGKVSVGLVAEVISTTGREETFRAGIIASAVLSNHLEVLGSFVPPLRGPDTLGIAGGDFGQLGLRYRWATGIVAEDLVVPVQ
jgi:hypothetical protein